MSRRRIAWSSLEKAGSSNGLEVTVHIDSIEMLAVALVKVFGWRRLKSTLRRYSAIREWSEVVLPTTGSGAISG